MPVIAFPRPLPAPRPARLLALGLLLAWAAPGWGRTEAEPVLRAADLVPPALLSGPGFRVDPKAHVVGYQVHFRIRTDWGDIPADSLELLAIRVAEMPALERLYGTAARAVLADTMADGVRRPIDAVGNIVREPVRTVTGLPGGVVRYFGDLLKKWGRRAKRLGQRVDRSVSHVDSPYELPDSPMAAARNVPEREDSGWRKAGDETARVVRGELRHGALRRALALELGIDPWTGNPLLRERLHDLAWAAVAGDVSTGQLFRLVDGGVTGALDIAGKVNRNVLELPPDDLRVLHDEALGRWCADATLRERFLDHGTFPPTLRAMLIDALDALQPADGCEFLLDTALMAGNEAEARFVVNLVRLLARDQAFGGRFVPVGAILAYETPQGEFVLPLPLDVLSWTPQMRGWFNGHGLRGHPRARVLVGGRVTPRAARALDALGWTVEADASCPDLPPCSIRAGAAD